MKKQMSNKNNIQILVATHKQYEMPKSEIYLPIYVGKAGKIDIGYIGDDSGENISNKNKNYCELTALYWAWKNVNCKYIGLNHYRRYFSKGKKGYVMRNKEFSLVLDKEHIYDYLIDYDIILPRKRNYYIESVRNQYAHAHNLKDLITAREIISEFYPQYIESFDTIMNGKKIHLYNMFITSKALFDEYAEWLFDILFKLESKINIENYSPYQARVFGFISERLFNVWIHYRCLKVKELGIICTEKEKKMKKYIHFLMRKRNGSRFETKEKSVFNQDDQCTNK